MSLANLQPRLAVLQDVMKANVKTRRTVSYPGGRVPRHDRAHYVRDPGRASHGGGRPGGAVT